MNLSTKYVFPITAVVIGFAAAWVAKATPSSSSAVGSAVAIHSAGGVEESGHAGVDGDRVVGEVLETIDVPNYTYLRIGSVTANDQKSGSEVWAAVASAKVKVGQRVVVVGAQRMEKFKSATLGKTFESIYFGALEGGNGSGPARAMPAGHPKVDEGQGSSALPAGHPKVDDGHGPSALPAGHPPIGEQVTPKTADRASATSGAANPHGSPTAGGDGVPVGTIEKAGGPLGHTVAEVVGSRIRLVGKRVRVRGVVVKSTTGVLGKTFLHLRDGSGSEKSGDHDLTVTTAETPNLGSRLLLEGTVVTDRDFGAGYRYPVLLEDAHTVRE